MPLTYQFALLLLLSLSANVSHVFATTLASDPAVEKPTYAGYIPISGKADSALYYAYWEAVGAPQKEITPIVLWLQGGPGCASTFGAFYELGPSLLGDGNLKPRPNPWSLHKQNGLLVIDQPIGTGYSVAGSESDIPQDMLGMAEDLYEGIWGFFDLHPDLQQRPFFIAGESYAGKYVPSITSYVLQAAADSRQRQETQIAELWQFTSRRRLRRQHTHRHSTGNPATSRHAEMTVHDSVPAPNFRLCGMAIGNGLTDPVTQTRALPSSVFNMGLVTEATRKQIQDEVETIIQLVGQQQWPQAAEMRSRLIDFITDTTGVATLLDIRRTAKYDEGETVQAALNTPEYKSLMQADAKVNYTSCSVVVEHALAADTMRSSAHLVERILDVLPVLLYQGQFDGQDGVASNNAWISDLDWDYDREFSRLDGQLWYVNGVPAGWIRNVSTLTQVMVRNAGHMVPRDQPRATQQMFGTWISDALQQMQQNWSAIAEQRH